MAGPNTRLVEDAIFDILETAGLPPEQAGRAAFALGHYVFGHTIEEQAQADLIPAGTWPGRLATMTERAGSGFARAAITAAFDGHPAERFGYGLRLSLDGLRQQLQEQAAARPGRRA